MAGNRAMNVQQVIFGVDPPNLGQRKQRSQTHTEQKKISHRSEIHCKSKSLGLVELAYLQSKGLDVNITQHAGHFFSFKNLGWVLHKHRKSYRHWMT